MAAGCRLQCLSDDATSSQIELTVLLFPPERDPHEPVAAQVLRPRGGRLWLILESRRRGVHEAEASDAGSAEENFDKATTESETAIGIIISNNECLSKRGAGGAPKGGGFPPHALCHSRAFVNDF